MIPFENLIKDLGHLMGLPLKADSHESCRLLYNEGLAIQIDLTAEANELLIGCELGTVLPGTYRDRVFKQALIVNGTSRIPRGVLAFTQKKDALILFQFLPLADYDAEKLYQFLRLFEEHARIWADAIKQGTIPQIEEQTIEVLPTPFGL